MIRGLSLWFSNHRPMVFFRTPASDPKTCGWAQTLPCHSRSRDEKGHVCLRRECWRTFGQWAPGNGRWKTLDNTKKASRGMRQRFGQLLLWEINPIVPFRIPYKIPHISMGVAFLRQFTKMLGIDQLSEGFLFLRGVVQQSNRMNWGRWAPICAAALAVASPGGSVHGLGRLGD